MGRLGWTAQLKQQHAEQLCDQVDELLFGCAVGGGKSEWLLHHVVAEMERHLHNRGLILRRTMPRLTRSLLPRADALLAGRTRPNRNDHTFTWPNGSVLEFGHVEHETSVHNYQGAEYGVIGFEEVTEFVEPSGSSSRPGCVPRRLGSGRTWSRRRTRGVWGTGG